LLLLLPVLLLVLLVLLVLLPLPLLRLSAAVAPASNIQILSSSPLNHNRKPALKHNVNQCRG
jgi:hypothetical protein